MDAVNAFNQELFSLMDMKPPISRAKMISITKSAIKAIKLYKHVVQIVEKFIKKCKPEYKVPGLYVVDSIVRQSRHQFGADKDVFGPRFTKNITGTFENLCLCPTEDRSKIVRVLNLWQKNGVFKIEIIQPLLDMAAGTGSSASVPDVDHEGPDGGSPPTPVKVTSDPLPAVTANSIVAAVPQLQNTDAFAAVAQLFQSSQGQQLQQMLQTFQQPGKNQSPALDNSLMAQLQGAQLAPHIQNPLLAPIAAQPMEQKAAFDKKLLDRFDYDDEPDGVEDTKKEETTAVTAVVTAMTTTTVPTMPPFGFHENIQQAAYTQIRTQTSQMEHFQGPVLGMPQDPAHQAALPPNGQLQNFGLMHPQAYPGMMPQMSHPLLPQQMPVGSGLPPGFPGVYAPQNEAYGQHMVHQMQDVSMDIDPPQMEGKHRPDGRRSRSHSGSRSPKRRRSRSNSRNRRSRHRRSRSRSRDRRRHSPRSRSQERRERERERERRLKGLPHTKNETLSVCSTTLWVGQLDKRTQQQDVACLLEEFGQIESINMIPPRGCAYIVMVHRQDAFRALQKLSRGSFKVNQKAIKIAWALNKGIKPEYKQYWDVELGVTYIPWSKVKLEDLDSFCQGGMLDGETLCPEWKGVQNDLEKPDEVSQNGRSEPPQADENPVAASVQVPPGAQPMGTVGGLQPPAFPTHMGLPPPAFPPGVPPPPPPPFMRPGFNPMQMPPGFLPPNAMPPMGSSGPPPPAVNMPSSTVPGSSDDPSNPSNDPGARNSGEAAHGSVPGLSQGGMPQQMAGMGNQVGAPPGGPPSGGLLGARPGMIPLQRPPGVPPPHMQRFPLHPPRPNMPPMPPQMMHRGPPQMMHREPPPGGFGMPPPHPIRGPFSPHGPPFLRPGGPRGPEGPDEREGRPFRNERPGFGRDRDQERFGGRRPPYTGGSEGRGGEQPEGRERFGNRHEEFERRGGWDRERRDWGRSPEPERAREPEERGRRTSGHRDREPGTRERSTRWDRDDRRDKADEADAADRYRDTDGTEPAADSVKELTQQEPVPQLPAQPSEVTAEPAGSEPSAGTKPADKAQETDS
ncbi:SR-related and CTD-associated factor 4 isoform X2 [Brienomyrus brachyistius]|uniref:SR-related and CTD-associated factor 4 isoform X2 n=1 Tax=Brienomyrus brachyistius TaxID=42636 RepID=UPI0020B23A33|nr:SR-related and CTD-associated factor 4 isoform X2 [Brienomyrus brachyistius]